MAKPLEIGLGDTYGDNEVVEILQWRGRKWIRVRCACGRRKLIPPGAFKIARSCKYCARAKEKRHDRALPATA